MVDKTFDESDCCGNGCANCVLDKKSKRTEPIDLSGKSNLLDNYTKLTLKSKVPHANLNDVLELHFISCMPAAEKDDYILSIPTGHHVMMRAPLLIMENEKTKNLLRPYSPYFVDVTNLEFKILVNLKSNGPMSKYIKTLHEGSMVEFRGPIGGEYTHKSSFNETKELYIISQGVAIAPTLPIIEEILRNEDDMTAIYHYACFSDLEHVYFRKCLHEYGSYWNYNLRIYLSRQQCGHEECVKNGSCVAECTRLAQKLFYKEKVFTRRLTAEELKKYCKPKGGREVSFVITGTRAFQDQIADILKSLDIGADDKNICLL